MTITTKAGLSAELGITKARVSQYVKRGMPVRSDGRVDRETALNWIASNFAAGGKEGERGVNRAAAIVKGDQARRAAEPKGAGAPDATDAMALNIAAEVIRIAGSTVADRALAMGLPARTAYVLEQLVTIDVQAHADDFLGRAGVLLPIAGGLSPLERMLAPSGIARDAAWPALAAAHGDSFDEDAWQADVDSALAGA